MDDFPSAQQARASTPPIRLDPNAPRPATTPLPLTTGDGLQAQADRIDAEHLLKSKRVEAGTDATRAMAILLEIPDAERASAIDHLDPTAFENLLDRVPENRREEFEELVDSSKDPTRKVRLWAEFHKSRAGNDLRRYAADFGTDDTRSSAQEHQLAQYERRERGVESTNSEVDREVARMMALDQAGKLTVDEVDRMRERKDLELRIETEHNVNLASETTDRADGSHVDWATAELDQVEASLSQLPDAHVHRDSTVESIHRRATRNPFSTEKGEYLGDHIDIYDTANVEAKGFNPERRQLSSNALIAQHGADVGSLEYDLTHELGHDVEARNPKLFQRFQAISGWHTVDSAELVRNQVSPTDMETLVKRDHHGEGDETVGTDIVANGKIYNPWGNGKFVAVDDTAFPDQAKYGYAKHNAKEHFAELYARAVHEPETQYRDLVESPAHAVELARAHIETVREQIAALGTQPGGGGASLPALQAALATATADEARKAKSQDQLGQQFRLMRDDVFHTDKSTSTAVAQMRAQGTPADQVVEFQRRAEHASTPAQLEAIRTEFTAQHASK